MLNCLYQKNIFGCKINLKQKTLFNNKLMSKILRQKMKMNGQVNSLPVSQEEINYQADNLPQSLLNKLQKIIEPELCRIVLHHNCGKNLPINQLSLYSGSMIAKSYSPLTDLFYLNKLLDQTNPLFRLYSLPFILLDSLAQRSRQQKEKRKVFSSCYKLILIHRKAAKSVCNNKKVKKYKKAKNQQRPLKKKKVS